MFFANLAPPPSPFSGILTSGLFFPPLMVFCLLVEVIVIWRMQPHVSFWRIILAGSLISVTAAVLLFILGKSLLRLFGGFGDWTDFGVQGPFGAILSIGVRVLIGTLGSTLIEWLFWTPVAKRWNFQRTALTILLANIASHLAWAVFLIADWYTMDFARGN